MSKFHYNIVKIQQKSCAVFVEKVSAIGGKKSVFQLMALVFSLLGCLLGLPTLAQIAPSPTALPNGGQVSAGQASIRTNGTNLVIQQSTDRASINWQTFNVGNSAHVQFQQPSASSITLNRVMSSDPSQVFGRITANGQVILTNPAGVYFGKDARVDVGGLVATTHNINDADFMAGKTRFERNGSSGSVINEGEIKSTLRGYIALLASEVRNQGVVIARMGTVAMAAGEAVDLNFDSGNRLTSIRVEPSQIAALVDNRYAVQAPGGLIIISAQSLDRLVGGVVKNSGRLEANGLQQQGGRLVLSASHRLENTGTLAANASVGATAADNGPAGSIELSAPLVINSGTISATGIEQISAGSLVVQATNFQQTTPGSIDLSAPLQGGSLQIQTIGKVELRGRVDASAAQDSVNTVAGTTAQGGHIEIAARGDIEVSGSLDVSGGAGGSIQLRARALIQPDSLPPLPDIPGQGRLAIMGQSTLSTRGRSGRGGMVTLLGDHIELLKNATIDASGHQGGGTINVGGGWQGSGSLYQATTITMESGAAINADATLQGNGGKVVLWSDVHKAGGTTIAQGSISARGGVNGGNGGQVETSGARLDTVGIHVDARAFKGDPGLWLLDPYDYTIDATAAGRIKTALESGTSVEVNTANATSAAGATTLTGTGTVGNITVSADISVTTSNANLTLRGTGSVNINANIAVRGSLFVTTGGNILIDGERTITTQGGNVVLWANNTGLTANGYVVLRSNFAAGTGARINTGGGHIWIGGGSGSTTWNGLTVGNGYAVSGAAISFMTSLTGTFNPLSSGIFLQGAKLISGGGNIYLAGQHAASGVYGTGLVTAGNVEINAGAGTIEIQARNTTAAGVGLGTGWHYNAANVALNGSLALSSTNNTASAILINSDATSGSSDGSALAGDVSMTATGGGGVTYNSLGSATTSTATGLTLGYSTTQGGVLNMLSNSGYVILNTGNRKIFLSNSLTSVTLGFKTGTPVLSSSSALKLITNDLSASGAINFNTSGQVTLEPTAGSSFSTTVNTTLLNYSSGVSGLTIGHSSNTSGVTVGAATIAGPVTIYGNAVTLSAALGTSGAGDVLIKTTGLTGSGNLSIASGRDLTVVQSGSATYSGIISGTNSTLIKQGVGTLTLSGANTYSGGTRLNGGVLNLGSANAIGSSGIISFGGGTLKYSSNNSIDYSNRFSSTASQAYSLDTNNQNVTLSAALTSAGGTLSKMGGGTLTLTGVNTYSGATTISDGTLQVGSGGATGNLGTGSVTNNSALTFNRSNATIVANAISGSGSVAIKGGNTLTLSANSTYTGATAIDNGTTLVLQNDAPTIATSILNGPGSLAIESTGPSFSSSLNTSTMRSGGLILGPDLAALRLGKSGNSAGIIVDNTYSIAGGLSVFGGAMTINRAVASSGSGNILLEGSSLTFGPSGRLQSGGMLQIQPSVATTTIDLGGAVGTFTLPASYFSNNFAVGFSGITIGQPTHSGKIMVGAISPLDALTLKNTTGGIEFTGPLEGASGKTVVLDTVGPITYTGLGSVSATSLALMNASSVTLDGSSNVVGTLASSGTSGLNFSNSSALTIGAVTTAGITATGAVRIAASGNLSVIENISTTDTSANAVVLVAGNGQGVGVSTGGDINITTGKTVTVGNGGTAKLYTGSISGSTSLVSLAPSGSGRFRYNSTESVSNFMTALDAGKFVIYREQPTANIANMTFATTYGDALPVVTAMGTVNGDTSSYSITGSTYSTANLLRASNSAYNIVSNIFGLGYNVTGVSSGTLTVNPKSVTMSGLSSQSRMYDGTTGATVNGTAVLQNTIPSGTGNSSDGKRYSGDAVNLTGAATGTFNSKNVTSASSVSFSGLSLTGVDATNYTLMAHSRDTSARITPKTVILSASKVYDGTTDLTDKVTVATGVGAETLIYTNATANDAHVATANKFISMLTLANATDNSGGLASNYQLPTLEATNAPATITTKTLTPTLINVGLTKVYDGTTNAPPGFTPNWTVSGLVPGDTAASFTKTAAAYDNSNVSNGTTLTLTGLAVGSITGNKGSQASDYALDASSKSVSAVITPAPLMVRANNDSKFLTQSDSVNFAGLSFSGFVNGETSTVLNGVAAVVRNNAATNAVGSYTVVLQPSGLTSSNYTISYLNGDYTIVPSNQLLVRVANISSTYGAPTQYAISSVEYESGGQVYRLGGGGVAGSSFSINSSNQVAINDGSAGQASFTLAPQWAALSSAGKLKVGNYQLGVSGAVTKNSANFSDTITVVGFHQVNSKPITASSTSVSKVYDGTSSMTGVTLGLATLETNDIVTVNGTGAFSSRNVSPNLNYTISGLSLSGLDSSNYYLSGGATFSGTNGSITARPLSVSFTGVSKVYDGGTSAIITTSDDRINGDVFTINSAAAFADKNVGARKSVLVTGVNLTGTDAGNYSLASPNGITTANIARLNSVAWIGGSLGNWFDPSNWAGSAVPDLSNVANVLIPAGVTVNFGNTVVAPAEIGAVNIDSLGSSNGSLTQSTGLLNVGSGGVFLNSFTQSGGAFSSSGGMTVGSLTQLGGTLSTNGNLTTLQSFSQGTSGSITVGGDISITDAYGGVVIGNLNISGTTQITSNGGDIIQAAGTTFVALGNTSLSASSSGAPVDINFNMAASDFAGIVSVSGANVALTDVNTLTLGTMNTTGNLTANTTGALNLGTGSVGGNLTVSSGNGNVTQTGALVVTGTSSINAGTGSVTLTNTASDFAGTVSVSGANVALTDVNTLTLGTVNTTGNLTANTTGALNLGTGSVGGNLTVSSGNGNVTQTGALVVTGISSINAGTGSVTLTNIANEFIGVVSGSAATALVNSGNAAVWSTNGSSSPNSNASASSPSGQTESINSAIVKIYANLPVSNFPGTALSNNNSPPSLLITPSAPNVSSNVPSSIGGTSAYSVAASTAGGAGSSGGKSSSSGAGTASVATSSGVTIDLQEASTASNVASMAAVSLPKGTSTTGTGFNFELPDSVRSMAQGSTTFQVALTNGAPLPTWLKFDYQTLRFEAKAIPDGAFPIQVALSIGGSRVLVVISERSE